MNFVFKHLHNESLQIFPVNKQEKNKTKPNEKIAET